MSKRRHTPDDLPATSGPSSRRVKFSAEETVSSGLAGSTRGPSSNDDFDLEDDELSGQKQRKGAVQTEGYDSDSSAGSDGGAARRRRKGTAATAGQDAVEDEDDDMFANTAPAGRAEGADPSVVDGGFDIKGAGKNKEYLDLGDIEGQEFGKGASDDEEDWSNDEEDFLPGDERANDDDAPRARRKSRKGMGFMMSKFNMAEELSEGRFTADGSYIASGQDPQAAYDSWLTGNDSKRDIKRAREAKRRLEEQQRRKAAAEDTRASALSRDNCLLGLLPYLRTNESVSQALARLGQEKKRRSRATGSKKVYARQAAAALAQAEGAHGPAAAEASEAMDIDSIVIPGKTHADKGKALATDPVATAKDPLDDKIAGLTDLASALMGTHGEMDAYELTHGSIVGMLKSEGAVRRNWVPPVDSSQDSEPPEASPPNRGVKKPLIARPTTSQDTFPGPSSLSALGMAQRRYEYRFKASPSVSAEESAKVYGPFGPAEMQSWVAGGYFGGPEAGNVEVRRVGEADSRWTSWGEAAR